MTDLLAKLASVFVEPAPEAARQRHHRVAVAPPAPCVGVIATPRHALAIGSGVALVVARGVRARRALVCAWPPGDWATPALQAPAGGGARRLRRSLAARGIDATATGSLVRTVLPENPEDAVATAERALAAAAAPAVLVLAGPRPEILDELLLAQDAIVVAADPDADRCVADLAVATLNARHPAVSACTLALGPVGRALAASGGTAPLGASRPLAPVLEAVV
ncbi:MAG: hypothetical protein ACJ767_01975 [Chloroflexota bacterium]